MIRGIKTSEFGALIVAGLVNLFQNRLHIAVTAAAVTAGLAGLYILGRSIVKWAEARNPAIATDAEKVRADAAAALAKAQALESWIKANPALSAEQAALIHKVEALAPVVDLISRVSVQQPAAPPPPAPQAAPLVGSPALPSVQ